MTNRLNIGAPEVEHFSFGETWDTPAGNRATINFEPGSTYLLLSSSASARELESAARQAAEALERMEAARAAAEGGEPGA